MGNEVADAVQYSGGYMGWLGDEHHHHHEHEQHQHHQHGDGEGEGSEEQGAMNLSDVLPCLPQPGVQAARGLAAIEGLRAEEVRGLNKKSVGSRIV